MIESITNFHRMEGTPEEKRAELAKMKGSELLHKKVRLLLKIIFRSGLLLLLVLFVVGLYRRLRKS